MFEQVDVLTPMQNLFVMTSVISDLLVLLGCATMNSSAF